MRSYQHYSATLAQVVLAGLIAVVLNTARANDGIYQGAGSSLTMGKNSNLRVREENLVISPITPPECYLVYANGKAIRDGMYLKSKDAKVTIGANIKCNDSLTGIYVAKWRAVADYYVETMQSQQNVLIGFPVHTWHYDFIGADGDLHYLHAPGVANFRTYINEEEIGSLELNKLERANDKTEGGSLLGYTWKTSFEGGKQYHLRTEYDFGVDTSDVFYYGDHRKFAADVLWFFDTPHGSDGSERFIYYLTPINSWASPPPEQIKIEIKLSAEVPVTYYVPLELKPVCVTTKALYFVQKNQFPSQELSVSMPSVKWQKSRKLQPLRTLGQWRIWQRTLGGDQVKIGCDVVEELKRTATPELQTHLNTFQCVSSCSE